MSDRYSRRLLEHLAHDNYEPSTIDRLADDLGIDPGEKSLFAFSVDALKKAGRVLIDSGGRVMLPAIGKEVVGVLKKNQRGFGFIIPEFAVREGDIFVPPDAMADALSGDTVRATIREQTRNGKRDLVGQIVEVVKRKRQRFTGELVKQGSQWLVNPDGRELTDPVVIRDAESKNARAGMKVVVEITLYPENNFLAEGVITEVLGEAGEPAVETQAVIAAYNLPSNEFPQACVEQARRASEQFAREIAELDVKPLSPSVREDLRGEYVITIDPPDAKDYDDAISIKRTAEGGWQLGVHIADVAHFIPPGSALDDEARKRGNSCYLPRHVIPMLPEVLSNGICSLQEGVPRYCKSTFMEYDRGGNILKSGVAQVVIKSAKRLTYLEAQALIDGNPEEAKKHAKTEPKYTDELVKTLREMDACAKAIRARRRAAGMIHLELPDVVLIYDDQGRVIDAEREDDAFTHTLIEMFMVEANEVLARLFQRLNVPLLRRIHPEPTPGDVEDLRTVTKVAGYTIPKKPTRMELQSLLDATRGTPAAPAVHFAVLRTLTRAEYSPAQIGHYALASEAYAHFTSPIRRYPDLTVHRALAEYLRLTDNGTRPPATDEARLALGKRLLDSPMCPSHEDLVAIGKGCTVTEENAAAAEDDLRKFLVLQLLANHIGETFTAMVTGVTNAGVFVQMSKYLAEGMIKTSDLPIGKAGSDQRGGIGGWRIDPRSGALVHQSSGRSFAIGDQIRVTVAKVDLALRRMDLVVADPNSRDQGKAKKVAPGGLTLGGGIGGGPGGGLSPRTQEEWDRFKYGQSGSAKRSQKSKARGKGKNPRRDG
jgi:ribonuclease R